MELVVTHVAKSGSTKEGCFPDLFARDTGSVLLVMFENEAMS